jgi:hypothetical protein
MHFGGAKRYLLPMNSTCVGCSEPTRHHTLDSAPLSGSSIGSPTSRSGTLPGALRRQGVAAGREDKAVEEKTRWCSALSEVMSGCSRAAASCGCFSKVHNLMMDLTVMATTSPSHATPRARPLF